MAENRDTTGYPVSEMTQPVDRPPDQAPASADEAAAQQAITPPPSPVAPSPSLLQRLRHHKVLEWTLAYAASAYTLLHGVEMLSEAQEWPHIIVRVLSLLLVVGVPIVATLAWYHGARGLQKVSAPELVIITFLGIIAGSALWYFAREKAEGKKEAPVATVAKPVTAAPRTAVAVLPFANLTGDASKDYLGDGMAEELINKLTRVPGLRVPARTSSFSYKGRNVETRQIAEDLHVGTILEGSVRQAGATIRITAQLIDAQTDSHIWSETYDRKATGLFKLQDELATDISRKLQVDLGSQTLAAIQQGPGTSDLAAYDLYLQGNALELKPSPENDSRAAALYEAAIRRDPAFARAYAGVASAHMNDVMIGQVDDEALGLVIRYARKALSLDPSVGKARLTLAGAHGMRLQWAEAGVSQTEIKKLAANEPLTMSVYGSQLVAVGRLSEARRAEAEAWANAPANPVVAAMAAHVASIAGADGDAIKYAKSAVDLGFPTTIVPLIMVASRHALRSKDYVTAGSLAIDQARAYGDHSEPTAKIITLVYAALADGRKKAEALQARQQLFGTESGHERFGLPQALGCLTASFSYALLGDNDVAYQLADQCLDHTNGDQPLGVIIYDYPFSPEFRAFRHDPRFGSLATRLGLMDYWQLYGPPDDCELKNSTLTCH